MKSRAKAPLTYTDLYPSFPWLIWETVVGQGLTMQAAADKAGFDQGTISKWVHNRTRNPEAQLLGQFARAFGLHPEGVLEILDRDRMRRFLGQAIPMPPLDEIRRGPKPTPRSVRSLRRVKRGLACLVAALSLTTSGAVPGQAGTLSLVETGPTSDKGRGIMSIRSRRRRAIWRARLRIWSDPRVGVSLIPSCNHLELRAS